MYIQYIECVGINTRISTGVCLFGEGGGARALDYIPLHIIIYNIERLQPDSFLI